MPARFFIEGVHAQGEEVELRASDAHKILNVLRLGEGDKLELIDSAGAVFSARVLVSAESIRARLEKALLASSEATLRITLAQGIPKGAKMDYVVEKATEIGVARILPFMSERVIGEERSASKLERWRRLARSAAEQSGRTHIPKVEEVMRWEALLAAFSSFDAVLLPWEAAPRVPLRRMLPGILADVREALVIIGPEGGITHTEAQAALAAGAHVVSLGARIFRTETAGLVACAALFYECGEI